MASLAQTARVTLRGFETEGITFDSPLEDQVVLVYRAVLHYANTYGWEPWVHRGHSGRKGAMTMKRIVESLFPNQNSTELEKLNGLINQVLRKTDAVVCIAHPKERGESPTWFINDRMPENLVIVALSHARGEKTPKPPRQPLIPTHAESKLTRAEVGEDREPAPVTVKQREPVVIHTGETLEERRKRALREQTEKVAAEYRSFVEEVYRLINDHAPVAGSELTELVGSRDATSTRNAIRDLEKAGRIVSRLEEDPERLIRGGGSFPKGKRVHLWAPAPGPVPTRRELPPGITARKGAGEWERERRERLDGWCDRVLEVLGGGKVNGTYPRSPGRIADVSGLSLTEVKAALDKLETLDLVYKSSSQEWYLAERRRQQRSAPEPGPLADTAEILDESLPLPLPPPPLPVDGDRREMAAELIRLAKLLADEPYPRVNPEELETAKARITELEAENARLKAALDGLRATVAALQI